MPVAFKLNLPTTRRRTVPTNAVGTAALSPELQRMAEEAGRNSYKAVQDYKLRWGKWLNNNSANANLGFLIFSLIYISLALTALILTVLVLHGHVDDFKRNEFVRHLNEDGSVKAYAPCGMPTPDSMYLLQAIGALPAAGWDGATLEPDYQNWMQKVERALCSRVVLGKEIPVYDEDMAVCEGNGYVDYGTDYAEEMLAMGYLLDDDSITPTLQDIDVQSEIEKKQQRFETRACLEKKLAATAIERELLPFYTEQQRHAYGDLKTRVGRAYIAAMPAFSRYQKERATCAIPEEYDDPFGYACKHSCHIRKELKAAAADQDLMYDSLLPATMPSGSTFTKQLYRLLALSLAGYYDRLHNKGACFRNNEVDAATGERINAMEFCTNSMKASENGDGTTFTNLVAVGMYTAQDQRIARSEECGNGHKPPPPAPPMYRNDPDNGDGIGANDAFKVSAQACAATLQYGLFEQGRLFGIPDVIGPFVIDNRVDRNLHFIGEWIYDAMYVEPAKKAGAILADPKARLEMYIAYRLSSTSIWAILVANVAGFMLVRAALPIFVWILSLFGVMTTNIKSDVDGTVTYEPIELVRPIIGWPIYLVLAVNGLIIYWIFWLDPATQSHYYTSTTCENWHGLGVHVPSGAFDTTWGRSRYERFGEHVIGGLMIGTFLVTLIQRALGQSLVPVALEARDDEIKPGETARITAVAITMIAFALIVQILFIAQSIVSGDKWFEAVRASDADHDQLVTFTKDVLMSVWAAFWTASAIAWYRQKWAVDKLRRLWQYLWMAGCVLLQGMPLVQSSILLADELDVAFTDGKGTTDTPRQIIFISTCVTTAFWLALLLSRLKEVWDALPDEQAGEATNTAGDLEEETDKANAIIDVATKTNNALKFSRLLRPGKREDAPGPQIDLSGIRMPVRAILARPQRKTGAVYMPLLPSY